MQSLLRPVASAVSANQRAQGQREAVGQRERSNSRYQPAVEAHEEQQANHEHEVVKAGENVLDTQDRKPDGT